MDFDLQRFAEDADAGTGAEDTVAPKESPGQEAPAIPEELNGLPEEYAREVMAQSAPAEEAPQDEPEDTSQPAPEEEKVSRADYQAKVAEAEQLKAQLAEYQRRQALAQQPQQTQTQQQPQQQQQFRITPEIAKQINTAIKAEAMALSGMTDDDVASLDYADEDDPRISQWAQAKSIAQSRVYNALHQMQAERQQQAQRFFTNHRAAVQTYNEFAQKEFAEPDFQQIQKFATTEYFEKLPPNEQQIIANAYLQVERQLASPAEMLCVKNYYKEAKAAYRTRGAKKTPAPRQTQPAATLPRTDRLRGTTTASDGQLSAKDIRKLLEGDFTELAPEQQRKLLGFN